MKGWIGAGMLLTAFVFYTYFTGHTAISCKRDKETCKGTNYFSYLKKVRETQNQFHEQWADSSRHDSLLNAAGKYLQQVITRDLFAYWNGTPWDFYGTTDTPQCGFIACGYFVTTLLRDAGAKIDRNGLAKDYSEHMIKKLLAPSSVKKYVPFQCDNYLAQIKAKGDALYIVGLDNHTGFISVEKGEAWFIHSTVLWPSSVVKERASESGILQWNRYTVSGCVTRDKAFLQRWIENGTG